MKEIIYFVVWVVIGIGYAIYYGVMISWLILGLIFKGIQILYAKITKKKGKIGVDNNIIR